MKLKTLAHWKESYDKTISILKNRGITLLTNVRIVKAMVFPVKVKVIQSCLTLCNPMDYTVHGILQPRILEWVAFPFSRGYGFSSSHVWMWELDHSEGWTRNFSSVQLLSRVWLFATLWITAHQASLSITNSRSLLKLMPIELVIPSSHLILCRPLLLLPPIPPSIRVFSSESALRIRWPKYWSFSFSISPSNEHPGLISFRMDWLDLLAVQGTLKSLLHHHSSKASIFWCSAFFTVKTWSGSNS